MFSFQRSILITGAAGFIGSALAHHLANLGPYKLTLVDNVDFNKDDPVTQVSKQRVIHYFGQNMSKLWGSAVYDTCDITVREDVERVFSYENYDVVIHLAGKGGVQESLENAHEYAQANLIGFTNVIEAARKARVKHFIYASSSSVYGADSAIPFAEEEPAASPLSFYAATKRANEMMAYSYSSAHGLPTTGLRFFTVFGPMCRLDMAPYKFTDAILNNKSIDLYNYGRNTRDFTHITEVVEFIKSRIEAIPGKNDGLLVPAKVLNVGNGKPMSTFDFICDLQHATGKLATIFMQPAKTGDMKDTCASTANMGMSKYAMMSNRVDEENYVKWHKAQIMQMVNWVKLHQTFGKNAKPSIELLLK